MVSLASPASRRRFAVFSPSLTKAKPISPAKKITCSTVPLLGTSTDCPSAVVPAAVADKARNGFCGTRLNSTSSGPGTCFGL